MVTTSRVELGRKSYMLKRAEEAATIPSSDSALPASKDRFKKSFPCFHEGRQWRDHDRNTDLMALAVMDEFPAETLTEVLRLNTEATDEPYLWLADTYETIPDYNPAVPPEGTSGKVDDEWRSPFIGCSLEEVAASIQAAPKPPKPLCKLWFAVLRKEQYEEKKRLSIYTIPEEGSKDKLQSVPCPINLAGYFFYTYDPSEWNKAVEEQALYYGQCASWSDDDEGSQLMALAVLDDIPTETIDQILEDDLEQCEDARLWLADTYSTLPDYRPNYTLCGTTSPISKEWRSPFAGRSIEDAANFVRNAPKPPKPICKRFFAVLQKDRFDQSLTMRICKIVPEKEDNKYLGEFELSEEEIEFIALNNAHMKQRIRDAGTSIICKAVPGEGEFEVQILEVKLDYAGMFFVGGNRYEWEEKLI